MNNISYTISLLIIITISFLVASATASTKKSSTDSLSLLPVEDYIQITDWFSRYASTVDHKQWGLFPDLFTKEAMIDYRASGGSYGNVAEMKAWLENVFQYFSASQHLISNIQIVSFIDERNVEVRAMFFNPMNLIFVPYQPFFTCGGWYNHKFVKLDDGKWRSKNLKVEMAFNNSTWHLGALFTLIFCIIYCCYSTRQHAKGKDKKN